MPTATDRTFGAKKWTLGPSVFGLYSGIPHFQMGALVTNTCMKDFSIALHAEVP